MQKQSSRESRGKKRDQVEICPDKKVTLNVIRFFLPKPVGILGYLMHAATPPIDYDRILTTTSWENAPPMKNVLEAAEVRLPLIASS
jgi:hypothetical protein